jgi:type IV pilus biogenesis protein CpaD/CtpE
MVMRVIMLVALAATVSGCAQNWVKPGATAADFEREKLLCRDDAEKATAAITNDPNSLEMLRLLNLCLQERGWTRG